MWSSIERQRRGSRATAGLAVAALSLASTAIVVLPTNAGATGIAPSITSVNGGLPITATGVTQSFVVTGANLSPLIRHNSVVLHAGSTTAVLKVHPNATSTSLIASVTPTSSLVGSDAIAVTTTAGSASFAVVIKAAPLVSSISPSTLVKGEQTQVTLLGSGFSSSDTLASSGGVTFSGLSVIDAGHATATATVLPTATGKMAPILMGDTSTSSPALKGRVGVGLAAPPRFAGRYNNAAGPGTTYSTSILGLPAGATPTSVTLGSPSASFALSSCATVAGVWTCAGTVTVASLASPGFTTVTAHYADGTTVTMPRGFKTTSPVVVSSMQSFAADGTSTVVAITGANFSGSNTQHPTLVIDGSGAGNTGTGTITVTNVGFATPFKLLATVSAPRGAEGTYEVTVVNPGHAGRSLPVNALTVTSSPLASSTSIGTVPNDGANHTVTLTGAGFDAGAVVSSASTGVTIGTTSVNVVTHQVTFTVNVDSSTGPAPGDPIDLTITNPDGGSGAAPALLHVSAVPSITSSSADTVPLDGTAHVITLTVPDVAAGASVASATPGVALSSTTVNAGTNQVTTSILLNSSLVSIGDPIVVTITNPDGGSVDTAAALHASAVPTLASVSPSTVPLDGTAHTITLSTTGETSGSTLTTTTAGVTISSVVVDTTAHTVTASVTLSTSSALATGDPIVVTITNPDGGSVDTAAALHASAVPTLASVSPSTVPLDGTAHTITLSTTGETSGSTLTTTTAGVTISSFVIYTTAHHVTASVTLSTSSALATGDPIVVTITNPDGGSVDTAAALHASAVPTLASVSPSTVPLDGTAHTITLSTTGETSGSTLTTTTAGVTISSVVVDTTAHTVTASVTLSTSSALATGDAIDLTLTNPDGGTVTASSLLQVG